MYSTDRKRLMSVDLSVVVPVYNEQECLPELHQRLSGGDGQTRSLL